MKKLLTILSLILAMPCLAKDIMPERVLKTPGWGVYQASNVMTFYESPNETSKILDTINCSSVENLGDLFLVYIPSKSLGFMEVTDETEDWVQVKQGWVKKDDPYKFLTWNNFYNMYGKKYGLYILKDAPDSVKELRSDSDENSQIIERINIPIKINLNAIRGNWMLVSVMDMDRMPKTGYIRWRSDDGVKYLFPAIK